ncbi:hypothetical protein Avbf_08153 [Armadillidium vulgare]|nr:hypothetical protein Avbf_08153 [Armadillidium vulgare]
MERWSGAHRAFAIEAYLTSGKSYAAARHYHNSVVYFHIMVKFAEAEKRGRSGEGGDRRFAPVMMLERPKISRGMWEALKTHILKERRRKKEGKIYFQTIMFMHRDSLSMFYKVVHMNLKLMQSKREYLRKEKIERNSMQ